MFIKTFAAKLNEVKAKAEFYLNEIETQYSLAARSAKINALITLNTNGGVKDLTHVIKSISDNFSQEMTNSSITQRIVEQVELYNKILEEFKILSIIIFDLVELHSPIKNKIRNLIEIDANFYKKYIVLTHRDQRASYDYLLGPTQSLFEGIVCSNQEIEDLTVQYAKNIESLTTYLSDTKILSFLAKLSSKLPKSLEKNCRQENQYARMFATGLPDRDQQHAVVTNAMSRFEPTSRK